MAGIRDVAKSAGVSIATVSRVFNEYPTLSVTKQTKEKISESVNYYNYKKKKVNKITQNLALITTVSEVDELEDPYFRAIRRGILQEVEKEKVTLKKVIRLSETALDLDAIKDCQGILIIGSITASVIEKTKKVNSNLVVIDDPNISDENDAVFTDLAQATIKHLDRLYEKGHRNIAFIGGQKTQIDENSQKHVGQEEHRKVAYENWMIKQGLGKYCNIFLEGWTAIDGMKAMAQLLKENKELPTAIVVGNDPIAVGVYRSIQKNGLKIPNDISIVSFDNIDVSQFLTPSLSTVSISTEEIGRWAVRLLISRIKKERKIPVQIKISNEIIVRESEKNLNTR